MKWLGQRVTNAAGCLGAQRSLSWNLKGDDVQASPVLYHQFHNNWETWQRRTSAIFLMGGTQGLYAFTARLDVATKKLMGTNKRRNLSIFQSKNINHPVQFGFISIVPCHFSHKCFMKVVGLQFCTTWIDSFCFPSLCLPSYRFQAGELQSAHTFSRISMWYSFSWTALRGLKWRNYVLEIYSLYKFKTNSLKKAKRNIGSKLLNCAANTSRVAIITRRSIKFSNRLKTNPE